MHIYSRVRPVSIHMLFRNKDEISQTKEELFFSCFCIFRIVCYRADFIIF